MTPMERKQAEIRRAFQRAVIRMDELSVEAQAYSAPRVRAEVQQLHAEAVTALEAARALVLDEAAA